MELRSRAFDWRLAGEDLGGRGVNRREVEQRVRENIRDSGVFNIAILEYGYLRISVASYLFFNPS